MAFEPRLACTAVWRVNHNWCDVQKCRWEKEGDFTIPHCWNQVVRVYGARDMDQFMSFAEYVHLDEILDRIKVPFLAHT